MSTHDEQQFKDTSVSIAEEGLKHSEDRFSALVEYSPEVILLLNPEGHITYANQAATKLTGYYPHELVGTTLFSHLHPKEVEEATRRMASLAQVHEAKSLFEYRLRDKSGSWRWFEGHALNLLAHPHVGAIVCNIRDVTERKEQAHRQMDAFLIDMQELTEGIVETVRQSLVVLDGKMRVVKANQYFYETFKVFPRETEGLYIYELGNGQWNIPELKELLERILPNNNPFDNFEVEHDFPGIGRRIMLLNARQIHLGGTHLERILLAIEDITDRRENERRKDDFLVMASHELRTPITSIKGFTQIVQHRLKKQGDEQVQHFLTKIDGQLNKVTRMMKELVDLSKMQAGALPFQKTVWNLDALVRDSIENVRGNIPHHILLEGTVRGRIFGDRDRLEQVFINLLTNACKYSPKADRIVVHLSREGDQAIVRVQDFGIGIAEAHQQRIFERYYQVSDATIKPFSGLGIGLYFSNEIVKRHHGHMAVESRPGQGATFSVILPLLKETA
jgi:PAS domain S-box-containing protein